MIKRYIYIYISNIDRIDFIFSYRPRLVRLDKQYCCLIFVVWPILPHNTLSNLIIFNWSFSILKPIYQILVILSYMGLLFFNPYESKGTKHIILMYMHIYTLLSGESRSLLRSIRHGENKKQLRRFLVKRQLLFINFSFGGGWRMSQKRMDYFVH